MSGYTFQQNMKSLFKRDSALKWPEFTFFFLPDYTSQQLNDSAAASLYVREVHNSVIWLRKMSFDCKMYFINKRSIYLSTVAKTLRVKGTIVKWS